MSSIDDGAAQFGRGEFDRSEGTFLSAVGQLKGSEANKKEFAEALEWLGRTRLWLGKLDDAEENLKESRGIKSDLYGPDSKDVAMIDLYLADHAIASENFPDAQTLAKSALSAIEKVTGPNDLAVAEAAARVGLATAYSGGKSDEAASYLNKALGIRKSKLGDDHPLIGETLDELSQCHALVENFTMAGALGRKALAVKEAALGAEHPEVGVTLYNLTTQYVRTHMFERGEKVARRGVEVLSQLPDEHAIKIRMAERLATICLANLNVDEAKQLQKKALESAERVWGRDDPRIVSNLVGLASSYLNCNDFEKAEEYFKRALKVMESTSERDTSLEYSLLQNLSCCYIFQLKLDSILPLVPDTMRSRYTSNFSSTLDLIRKLVEFAGKQYDGYKKDRYDFN